MAARVTGQYAAFGEQIRRGAEVAVADINAKDGCSGRNLILEAGGDVCDPKHHINGIIYFPRVLKRRGQFANRNTQTLRQFRNVKQGYVPFSAFDGADIGSVQLRGRGQAFLRKLGALAPGFNVSAEVLE